MALHGLSLESDEYADLKRNEIRDLRIAIEVLLQCTLNGISKTRAMRQIAEELVQRGANSLESAVQTVKSAWRSYKPGCHFAAAEMLVAQSEGATIQPNMNQSAIDSVSLAEMLRASGERTVPTHGHVPILDPACTWKVPNFFPLSPVDIVHTKDEILFQSPAR